LKAHKPVSNKQDAARACELLEEVGIPEPQ